jgi:hypothetical protein
VNSRNDATDKQMEKMKHDIMNDPNDPGLWWDIKNDLERNSRRHPDRVWPTGTPL